MTKNNPNPTTEEANNKNMPDTLSIGVVIPSYKVTDHILNVISRIGPEVEKIYIIDDCCPDHSGQFVAQNCHDPRVTVLYHTQNKGVGGAVITGYQAAISDGIETIVKIDGDGQMDPALILEFVAPIFSGHADYTKGNRFFNLEGLENMPKTRIFGNAVLSLLTKISSGYWSLFDPTNGYTAIHRDVASILPLHKISCRYFFETDMLFRLNILKATVMDIPMTAVYGDEVSNLKIRKIIPEFLRKHFENFIKRLFYNYYLRDMSIASFQLPLGILLLIIGGSVGITHWLHSVQAGIYASAGTVMLAGLPILLGTQFILSFLSYDIISEPGKNHGLPLHRILNTYQIQKDLSKPSKKDTA